MNSGSVHKASWVPIVSNVASSVLIAGGAWVWICLALGGPRWAGGGVAVIVYLIEINARANRKSGSE